MKTFDYVRQWTEGAARDLGDPCEAVCQLFFRWRDDLTGAKRGRELVCGMVDGEFAVVLGPAFPTLPIPIASGPPQIAPDGSMQAYGAIAIAPGVWALTPSLNVEQMVHSFVVLYDVPNPPPWERRIIVVDRFGMEQPA